MNVDKFNITLLFADESDGSHGAIFL